MEMIETRNGTALLDKNVSQQIADFERQMQILKEKESDLKTAILQEMEDKGILKLETDELSVTYVAKTMREKFDSRKFRFDNPDLYDDYISMIPVKSSIRVKLK